MRAFIAITLFAALALAGCAANDDDATGGDDAGNSSMNTTVTPSPSPTPEECSGVEPPVGPPCVEPPAPRA